MPFFSNQKAKKGAAQKDRKFLDYNFFPLTKHHTTKNYGPNPTHINKRPLESLDFYPCQTRSPTSLMRWCRRQPSRDLVLSSIPDSNKTILIKSCVNTDHLRSLGLYSYLEGTPSFPQQCRIRGGLLESEDFHHHHPIVLRSYPPASIHHGVCRSCVERSSRREVSLEGQ